MSLKSERANKEKEGDKRAHRDRQTDEFAKWIHRYSEK
jgi:hypothetical protein